MGAPGARRRGFGAGESRLARLAGVARRPPDDLAQFLELDEVVSLAAQFVGDHRRLAADRRDHRHPNAGALERLDQRLEVAIAREQHGMIQPWREFHRVHRQLDVHVALDLPPPGAVGVFLGGLGDHRVAVVLQPVDQRADRGVVLGFDECGVVEGAHQLAPPHELLPQQLVVDVEAQRLAGREQIGAINEQGQPFILVEHE
jgi:hypothetical protein